MPPSELGIGPSSQLKGEQIHISPPTAFKLYNKGNKGILGLCLFQSLFAEVFRLQNLILRMTSLLKSQVWRNNPINLANSRHHCWSYMCVRQLLRGRELTKWPSATQCNAMQLADTGSVRCGRTQHLINAMCGGYEILQLILNPAIQHRVIGILHISGRNGNEPGS